MGSLARFIRFFTDEDDGGNPPGPPPVEKTVKGAIVHILDALARPAIKLVASIEPVQDLHGYDSPWPAGGGKNLLNVNASSTVIDGVTFTVNSDGTISTRGTANANGYLAIADAFAFKAGTSYIFNGCPQGGSNSTYMLNFAGSIAIDAGNGSAVYTPASDVSYIPRLQYWNGADMNGLVFKPMLRLSSVSDATFAPYSNLCPISGWTGVNVWNEATYDQTAQPKLQVSWQDTAGTVYGGNLTVNEDGSRVLTATHKYYENAGTGAWSEVVTAGARYYVVGVSADAKNNSANGWCNIGNLVSDFNSNGVLVGSNGRINLCGTLHSAFASVDDLKTYLNSNPLQVVYELATPLTYTLPDVTMLEMFLGTNNIWVNTGDTEVTYYADGRASTAEALGILLGGAYHNNGTAEDVPDAEALDIIMGESI